MKKINERDNKEVTLQHLTIEEEAYYMISNYDAMDPFLMSIVSDSNHWMYISSNGGLSAGRKDAENALFPYYTNDKLTEMYDVTGSKSIFWITINGASNIWEPFSERYAGQYQCTRNLYKNFYGNKVIFEEVNQTLGLTFRYQWNSSNQYGFVKKSSIINHSDKAVNINWLDGIQNIMPHGVTADLQAIRSNLVDAYKKSELEVDSGLGIYALSAIIVDRAEPSEALKANVAWYLGLEKPIRLLSSVQLPAFRSGQKLIEEVDLKAKRGAYFVSQEDSLSKDESLSWMIIANVNQTAATITALAKEIKENKHLKTQIENNIAAGSQNLMNLIAASDGYQFTADKKKDARHYSNTLFNIMRGGIFDNNYQIEKWDFENYLQQANPVAFSANKTNIDALPDSFSLQLLRKRIAESEDKDFIRLSIEYLPLKFSRRHGDPSRPWNKFSINTRNELDGSKVLDYEGNWRDIFQNWEALAHAYPEFIDSMIFKFLNASTFDGYNPYRVTKGGFDWEVVEEHDPWSYIGYWGDHQIIYLLKFLEFTQDYYPEKLKGLFDEQLFVYANVPYKIKSYQDILNDPKDTIVFDHGLDLEIRERRKKVGADGGLIRDKSGDIYRVSFIEKILATVLAKLSNFIPEAGIWLNTQRPEWNDANNALVGNGVSMVTLCYLRRFLSFFELVLESTTDQTDVAISEELLVFFDSVKATLTAHQESLNGSISDKQRKQILDALGHAGSEYRNKIYADSFSGKKHTLKRAAILDFIKVSRLHLEHSIAANKREDNMYHAYNLMTLEGDDEISISYLDEMLEGQVAALSSGYLSAIDSLSLLDSMKQSRLFRADQFSYLLYPNKELKRFLDKNVIPEDQVAGSPLLKKLIKDGNTAIIEQDIVGKYHFNANFNNAENLKSALKGVAAKGYESLVESNYKQVLQIFEGVFNHKAFTGRSGTFFGYEGLGSIYWHMVSKLLLAVEETCIRAIEDQCSEAIKGRLLEHFYEINEGIGIHKSPQLYGAFSIDPYSHTPTGKGAQQPGMTGQVKEDILSRMGELGIAVNNGQLHFKPTLLRKEEFLLKSEAIDYVDLNQERKTVSLEANTLAFTYCQVLVIYEIGAQESIKVFGQDNLHKTMSGTSLDQSMTDKIFERTGEIVRINVTINQDNLK